MDVSDKELFESAISPDPAPSPEPAPVAETTPAPPQEATQPEARERDEKGRFVGKPPDKTEEASVSAPAPVAPTATPPQQAAMPEANVPSWRLREEREAREAAELRWRDTQAQLAEMRAMLAERQQQAEVPDMFADPAAWQAHARSQVDNDLASQRFDFSEMLAREKHGDAKVEEALKWAESNLGPAEKMRVQNARHPYGELIRIQGEHRVLSEIGTDPEAYVQRKLEEALSNPEFLAKAVEKARGAANGSTAPAGKGAPVVQLPPSLSRAPAAAAAHDPRSEDLSDSALFAHAMAR